MSKEIVDIVKYPIEKAAELAKDFIDKIIMPSAEQWGLLLQIMCEADALKIKCT